MENLTSHDQYRVLWDVGNLGDIGDVDSVQVAIGVVMFDVKVNSRGPKVLGKKAVAADAVVTVQAREITPTVRRKLTPWAAASGGYSGLPAATQDLYDYAELLTLHPTNAGVATDRDMNFVRAVPWVDPEKLDGENNTVVEVRFYCFFDRDDLAANTLFYFDDVPVA